LMGFLALVEFAGWRNVGNVIAPDEGHYFFGVLEDAWTRLPGQQFVRPVGFFPVLDLGPNEFIVLVILTWPMLLMPLFCL